MTKKRWWIALVVISVCLMLAFAVGTQRSHPANAGDIIDPTCTSPSPCIQYTNNSSGAGIEGLSLLGNAVFGVTQFKSTSTSNGKAGIFGNDLSTAGAFDSGVSGLSVRGTGVSGQSTSGAGLMGISKGNNGVFGDSKAAGGSGVYGQNDGGGFGVAGRIGKPGIAAGFFDAGSTGSIALSTSSLNGVGANIIGGNSSLPALSIVGNSGADLIDACLAGSSSPCSGIVPPAFFVDSLADVFAAGKVEAGCFETGPLTCAAGNVDISGEYQVNGNCAIGCAAPTATSAGRAVVTYVPTQSLPTIDDFGEATLQNGFTYVRLDSAFANVIDRSANYLVFITPEGDSRGLYVTAKSINGFAVHENMGGHSSLAFSYRIVARPLGKQAQRLPIVTTPKLHSLHHIGIMPRQIPAH